MKRDIDLIVKILTKIEEHPTLDFSFEHTKISSGEYTKDEILYALQLIKGQRLALFSTVKFMDEFIPIDRSQLAVRELNERRNNERPYRTLPITFPFMLTWRGHDFLEEIRKAKKQ